MTALESELGVVKIHFNKLRFFNLKYDLLADVDYSSNNDTRSVFLGLYHGVDTYSNILTTADEKSSRLYSGQSDNCKPSHCLNLCNNGN